MAYPRLSTTHFTRDDNVTSLLSLNGVTGVLYTASGASCSARTHASMISGSMSGSSPCTFTTTSNVSPIFSAALSHRSVPFGMAASVMTTSAPAASHAALMRASSVATTRRVSVFAFLACSYVRTIMGLPAIITRGLPGKRDDAYRAGITPRTRVLPVPLDALQHARASRYACTAAAPAATAHTACFHSRRSIVGARETAGAE